MGRGTTQYSRGLTVSSFLLFASSFSFATTAAAISAVLTGFLTPLERVEALPVNGFDELDSRPFLLRKEGPFVLGQSQPLEALTAIVGTNPTGSSVANVLIVPVCGDFAAFQRREQNETENR